MSPLGPTSYVKIQRTANGSVVCGVGMRHIVVTRPGGDTVNRKVCYSIPKPKHHWNSCTAPRETCIYNKYMVASSSTLHNHVKNALY